MENRSITPKRNLCPKCKGILRIFEIKLITTNNQTPHWPKYVPQIKEVCANCGRYIRFATQTPELIAAFNKYFKENNVEINEDA